MKLQQFQLIIVVIKKKRRVFKKKHLKKIKAQMSKQKKLRNKIGTVAIYTGLVIMVSLILLSTAFLMQ